MKETPQREIKATDHQITKGKKIDYKKELVKSVKY